MSPLLAALFACTDDGGTGDIVPPDDTGEPEGSTIALGPDLVVTDDNIHSYDASWRFPTTPIRPEIEVFVNWDGIVADAWGLARAPDSFDTAVLLEIPATMQDLVLDLAKDTLSPTNRWQAPIAGKTGIALSELEGFDPDTMLTEDPSRTLLLTLCDDDGNRIDVRDGVGIAPSASQPGTVLAIPNGGAEFSWAGKLDGSTIRTEAGYDLYSVDWSGVTTDGYGNPFSKELGDEFFVGRFDDVDEADDLGDRLLDLEAAASDWWTTSVRGTTSLRLSNAGYPGFEAGAVYVIGVRCITCLGPAPLWAAGVEVR